MSYLEIGGSRLFYERTGVGSPPLLFVHGFACGQDDWRYQVEHFSRSNLTVACDLRGHGNSGTGHGECTIEALGDDIGRLLKSLNLPPAVLIGHSMGCRVVLQAYRTMPEVVSGLILVDGSRLATGSRPEVEKKARQTMKKTGYADWARRAFDNMSTAGSDASLRASIIKRALALSEQVGIPLFTSLCGWDAGEMDSALVQIRVPLLLIQSTTVNANMERVSLQPRDTTPWLELVRSHVPGAQIEIISGTGHFPMLEAPEEVNQRIAAFLAAS